MDTQAEELGRADERHKVFISINDIAWIGKNVFVVSVPAYKRRISCELTAVDVPRGTASALEEKVMRTLNEIRCAPYKYLRRDHYASFPNQGYGDIIFRMSDDAAEWVSLQERLLRRGVGSIVRPIVARLEELIQAEFEGSMSPTHLPDGREKPCVWANHHYNFENGPLFRKQLTGQIINVMRGDVYVVRWDKGQVMSGKCTSKHNGNKDAGDAHHEEWPPQLVILDAVKCFSPRTANGFAALRWAQKRLLYSRVKVCIHSTHPSEKDVSNNTQLFSHEQLRCVRSAVYVLPRESGLCASSTRRATNVGSALISKGLGLLRQVVDAAVPRSSDFHELLRAARDRCCAVTDATLKDAKQSLPDNLISDDGVSCPANVPVATWCNSSPSLKTLWQTTMWDGDVHRSAHDYPQRIYCLRPLRSLCDMRTLIRECETFEGFINSVTLVRESLGASLEQQQCRRRRFLRVEINAIFALTRIQDILARVGANTFGSVRLHPTGGSILGNTVKVTVVYDRWLSVIPITETAFLNITVTGYAPQSYDPAKHAPKKCQHSLLVKKEQRQGTKVLELELSDDENERIFVVDVRVEFGNSTEHLNHQSVYFLTRAAQGPGTSGALLCDDDYSNGELASVDSGEDHSACDSDSEEESDRQNEQNQGAEEARLAGNDDEAAERKEKMESSDTFCHSSVDFYFEVMTDAAHKGGESMRRLRDWGKSLMYRDVRCIPMGIGTVNGARGFLGDVLLIKTQEEEEEEEEQSIFFTVEKNWRPPAHSSWLTKDDVWTGTTRIFEQHHRRRCNALFKREFESRDLLIKAWYESICRIRAELFETEDIEVMKGNMVLDFATHLKAYGAFLACDKPDGDDNAVIYAEAGRLECWYNSDTSVSAAGTTTTAVAANLQVVAFQDHNASFGLISPSFLPPKVPLSAFSLFPRQFFSAHSKQHRALLTKNNVASMKEGGDIHVDAAFFRLPHRFLPNLFASNFERLPAALRNVERAFCDSLQQGDIPRPPNAPEVVYYATQKAFVSILSMLLLLQLRRDNLGKESSAETHPYTSIYKLLRDEFGALYDLKLSRMTTSLVLYRVEPNLNANGDGQQRQPALLLGSHDTETSDTFEVPGGFTTLDKKSLFRAIGVLGFESLVAPRPAKPADDLTNNDDDIVLLTELSAEECHPMTSRGVGPYPLASSTPRLYHPFPWLTLLGQPLLARDEYDAESLGNHEMIAEGGHLIRRYIAVSYTALCLSERKPYRSFSYGRITRSLIYGIVKKQAEKGSAIMNYLSLLLRSAGTTAEGASPFADGILNVYGTASELLYLFYQSRRQLRFRLGMLFPSLLKGVEDTTAPTGAEVKAEEEFLQQLSEAGKQLIDLVAKQTAEPSSCKSGDGKPPARVYLKIDLDCLDAGTCMWVSVYPIKNEPEPEGYGEAVGTRANPHQQFDLASNVWSRFPQHVLLVRYHPEHDKYAFEWSGVENPSHVDAKMVPTEQ
ncbi:hypothetical protein TraAM80_05135 [Trypanosoma rangeli]|uniref:Uncharacterized protein n=1 Tax=Trypanosoma rangeli TaxID=5698 RepID=A0A3R7KAR4_TRYRA|nr:uncharacterized protein TraAM80_05135 [Trypanosoma rangeli]RNF04486.1 hypothetical protein TraAM80_05135 [Trypanosoma rangeli]|eukprot:RNF04486.1 hypothetical protein TraAM80_05135 [Trypanosoma rangeli]